MVDVNLSNGTCYFAQQSETSGDFIPCGNIALGNWPCCKAGDVCLGFETANACYDYNSTNTYIAGCTDATYGDSTCPQKAGFGDQEWVAIQHCGTDASSGDTNWGGCRNIPANDTALTKLPNSRCDPYCASTTLWVGGATIEAYATVPTAAGGSMTWTNDFDPAATTTRAPGTPGAGTTTGMGSAEASSSTSTSTSTPTSTSTSTPPPSDSDGDGGLDTGAKIGIGIGSAGAALLVVAVFLLSLLVRRRNKKRGAQQQQQQQQQQGAQDPPMRPAALVDAGPCAAGGGGAPTHLDAQKPPPRGHGGALGSDPHDVAVTSSSSSSYTGAHLKHELPAAAAPAEVEARSPGRGGPAGPDADARASASGASTLVGHEHVSPQSTGATSAHVGYGRGGWGEAGTISEMQG